MSNQIKYAWRPATKADIGSIARFGHSQRDAELWQYGILAGCEKHDDYGWLYICGEKNATLEDREFLYCEIQYIANEQP